MAWVAATLGWSSRIGTTGTVFNERAMLCVWEGRQSRHPTPRAPRAEKRNQGRWKEAESLEVQVMEMRKRVVGEEHPGTLRIMGNLTTAYRNQGRWEETEELEKQMMETNSRVVGEQYPVEVVVVHHTRVITLLFQPSQVQRANKLMSCWLLASRSRR